MQRLWARMMRRSILLGLGLALFAITFIGVGGMTASVMVVERIQGSGSAINVAGSLRRLTHRMSAIVLSDAENQVRDHQQLRESIAHFERSLNHPALARVMARKPDSAYARTYGQIKTSWQRDLKPLLTEETLPGIDLHPVDKHNQMLAAVETFVEDLNAFVAQLETDAEETILTLRSVLGAALVLTVSVVLGALIIVRRGVLEPLTDLVQGASRIASGDFSARAHHEGADELGQVGRAFNFMARELDKLYADLERRVTEKTAELERSNQSLELLYHAIARLHNAPTAPETYQSILDDMGRLLDLRGGMACLLPKLGGPATVLSNTMGICQIRQEGRCPDCVDGDRLEHTWRLTTDAEGETLVIPLRDADRHYGVLRLALPLGRRPEPWQEQLLQALCRHIGIALGITHRTEQQRLLALQEERSIIARELHDSLAQALSYLKIQSSLLQPLLADPARRPQAQATLADLRAGISAAYRQLRELLATFRLRMDGDFLELLDLTVNEFSTRGGLPIELDSRLAGCALNPNQEIHVLQIIREALSNILRHAQASSARVRVWHEAGLVTVRVEDDGIGIDLDAAQGPHHYGLGIMGERAQGLSGQLRFEALPDHGTRVTLEFRADQPSQTLAPISLADAA